MSQKPKVCLSMIVKNEAHIIKQTLENISKYIDYYVINDTGSSDNTREIIKEYFCHNSPVSEKNLMDRRKLKILLARRPP